MLTEMGTVSTLKKRRQIQLPDRLVRLAGPTRLELATSCVTVLISPLYGKVSTGASSVKGGEKLDRQTRSYPCRSRRPAGSS